MDIKFSDIFSSGDININNAKFEELFNKTKDVAQTVSQRSAQHIELSRKKVELLDAKTKLSKMYEKFGKIQYDAYIGESFDSAELESLANNIASLKEKIDIYTMQIEEAKAQFNDAVAAATKKTRDAFQKEFDKKAKSDVVGNDEVEVKYAENSDDSVNE